MKRPKLFLFLLLLFGFDQLSAQHTEHQEEDHHHKKDHGIYELITSGIFAYHFAHQEGAIGTEVHFTYWFDHTYGSGLSYTAKFEEEETVHDIAVLGSWNPTRWVTLNVGPNFSLPGDHRDFALSGYAESEFNIRPTDWFHFGPIIGTILGRASELSAGFHLGFEF